MYLLFMDETNKNKTKSNKSKFFIYGGIIIDVDKLEYFHRKVNQFRDISNFNKTDDLKWNGKPKRISVKDFNNCKENVLDLCVGLECKFIAMYVLHEIACDPKTKAEYGSNAVLRSFNDFLIRSPGNAKGIVISDRSGSDNRDLNVYKERFRLGLKYGENFKPLTNIISYSISCIGCSYIASACDLILGGFQKCVNSPNSHPSDLECRIFEKIDKMAEEITFYPRNKNFIFEPDYKQIQSKLKLLSECTSNEDIPF